MKKIIKLISTAIMGASAVTIPIIATSCSNEAIKTQVTINAPEGNKLSEVGDFIVLETLVDGKTPTSEVRWDFNDNLIENGTFLLESLSNCQAKITLMSPIKVSDFGRIFIDVGINAIVGESVGTIVISVATVQDSALRPIVPDFPGIDLEIPVVIGGVEIFVRSGYENLQEIGNSVQLGADAVIGFSTPVVHWSWNEDLENYATVDVSPWGTEITYHTKVQETMQWSIIAWFETETNYYFDEIIITLLP